MRLKTRIMLLFVLLMAFFLLATVLNSVNQHSLLDNMKNFTDKLEYLSSAPSLEILQSETAVLYKKQFETYHRLKTITAIQIGVGVLMMFFAFIFGVYFINQYLSKRLLKVIEFYNVNRSGKNPDARLVLTGKDELNMISSVLNDALDERDSEISKFEGRLKQERKILLTLINNTNNQMALYRLNGDFVGSNLTPLDEEEVSEMVKKLSSEIVSSKESIEFELDLEKVVRFSVIGPSEGIRILIKAEVYKKIANQSKG